MFTQSESLEELPLFFLADFFFFFLLSFDRDRYFSFDFAFYFYFYFSGYFLGFAMMT